MVSLKNMTLLVIGGDSVIGRAVASEAREAGASVIDTTRNPVAVGRDRLLLDLTAPVERWPEMPDNACAVICAAISRIGACEDDPALSARVNVEAPVALTRLLVTQGAQVLFLSTNHAIDGSMAFQKVDAPRNVPTRYGAQKAAAEDRLLAFGERVAILRLSKVVAPGDALFAAWLRALSYGERVDAFCDLGNAPIPLDFVASLALRILASGEHGVFQASGDSDLAYSEMAMILADSIGARRDLVHPSIGRKAGTLMASYPRYSSLDMSRIREAFGLQPPSAVAALRDFARRNLARPASSATS